MLRRKAWKRRVLLKGKLLEGKKVRCKNNFNSKVKKSVQALLLRLTLIPPVGE